MLHINHWKCLMIMAIIINKKYITNSKSLSHVTGGLIGDLYKLKRFL